MTSSTNIGVATSVATTVQALRRPETSMMRPTNGLQNMDTWCGRGCSLISVIAQTPQSTFYDYDVFFKQALRSSASTPPVHARAPVQLDTV